jgi:hypothetical protein
MREAWFSLSLSLALPREKKKVAGLHKQTATGAAPGNRIGNHQPGPGVPTRYGEAFGLAKEA